LKRIIRKILFYYKQNNSEISEKLWNPLQIYNSRLNLRQNFIYIIACRVTNGKYHIENVKCVYFTFSIRYFPYTFVYGKYRIENIVCLFKYFLCYTKIVNRILFRMCSRIIDHFKKKTLYILYKNYIDLNILLFIIK